MKKKAESINPKKSHHENDHFLLRIRMCYEIDQESNDWFK